MDQSASANDLPSTKKRRLTVKMKDTFPVEEQQGAGALHSERTIASADATTKAAADDQFWQAIRYKNCLVDCMARNDFAAIKEVLTTLEAWAPSPAALRKSGLLIVFHDIKFWEDAKVFERAAALRTKLNKVIRSEAAC